jgi:glycine/D-amino acid oxidase-like deaminating enzyme
MVAGRAPFRGIVRAVPRPDESAPDVVVIGAGLRGTLAAQKLAAAGLAVVVVEAADVGAHGGRAVPLIPPGLDGDVAAEAALRHAEALCWLAACAPHLSHASRLLVGVPAGWVGRRAALALAVHDGAAPLSPAAAEHVAETDLFGRRGAAIACNVRAIDEARLALAALGWAARRGTVLVSGRAIGVEPGEVSLEDRTTLSARVVIDAAGLLPAPREHVAHLRVHPLAERACVVEVDGLRIAHVPTGLGAILEVRSRTALDPEELKKRLGLGEVLDFSVHERHAGPPSLKRLGRGHFALLGQPTGALLGVLRQLALEVGRTLERSIDERVGEDARLEEGEAEISPALERAHLGAPILRALEGRHGARASMIVERVLRAPREGALVCPCASVIEAELRFAAEHEHGATLSAVVRRTDLGVGGCQGVRCAARAGAILGTDERLDLLRRSACLLDQDRRAALDELARGLRVARGQSEERSAR